MAWTHKGITIEAMSSGNFTAVYEGVKIIKPSLIAVKKDIDKRQETKATAIPLNLPVVILQEPSYFKDEEARIIHSVITGLDPDSRKIQGIDYLDGWRNGEILPDSKENTRRLEKLVIARADLKAAEKSIKGREVSLYLPKLARNKPMPYGSDIMKIKENYVAAQKGKAY